MSPYAGSRELEERYGDTSRKAVTTVEPVDDIRFLCNYNVPDRDFRATASEKHNPPPASRFSGAACRDENL
jgi:hypothetical protein